MAIILNNKFREIEKYIQYNPNKYRLGKAIISHVKAQARFTNYRRKYLFTTNLESIKDLSFINQYPFQLGETYCIHFSIPPVKKGFGIKASFTKIVFDFKIDYINDKPIIKLVNLIWKKQN